MDAIFDVDDRPGRTSLDIALTQVATNPSVHDLQVVILLCGAFADDPQFMDNKLRPIEWTPFRTPGGVTLFSQAFGSMQDCVHTSMSIEDSDESGRLRQALMIGSSGAGPSKTSGARVTYRFPGIVQLPALPKSAGFGYPPLPTGSSVHMRVKDTPADMENVFTSPQLADAGRLEWEFDLASAERPVSNLKITAQLADRQAARERQIFVAGGLVGIAGGAFVWLSELVVSALTSLRRNGKRRRGNPSDSDDRHPDPERSTGRARHALHDATTGEQSTGSTPGNSAPAARRPTKPAASTPTRASRTRRRLLEGAGFSLLGFLAVVAIVRRARRRT
ncbi:hypothetical protein [Couchioplanes azureus]|uniref:hypothetical protein n=1 Tax=Couchioplanes caeruleus TaxID=56438 RepID=UPI0016715598|nr:hypothetical protein [Couchioplanes caeruleus]